MGELLSGGGGLEGFEVAGEAGAKAGETSDVDAAIKEMKADFKDFLSEHDLGDTDTDVDAGE